MFFILRFGQRIEARSGGGEWFLARWAWFTLQRRYPGAQRLPTAIPLEASLVTKVRDFIGPYRLARMIRTGNTCSVWEAIKDDNERYCLKVLRQDLRKDKFEIGQLRHEYNVAHNLKHPNVIRIHEFKLDGKTPYLAMELYAEQNMKIVLRNGHENLAFYVTKIVQQGAEALYHMHENGWVHCDVKPDNLLLSADGDLKLIDFSIAQRVKKGLAKMFGGGKPRGTRSYMSPEQIRGKALDARSDLYSYGCVLFELLVGKPPYTGNTGDELLQKHLSSAIPSVLVGNENITNDCNMLVKRMLAKRAEDRPASLWEFLKEFRAIKVFKKAPRLPSEKLLFDTDQYDNPDSLFKKGATDGEDAG